MDEPTYKSVRDIVLDKIKTGKAHMRPRWHFVLKATLALIGLGMLILVAIYVVSLALFIFHTTGIGFLSGFGLHGIALLLISLPWLVILVGLVFIGVMEMLVRHYAFAYRKPLLYSTLGITGIVILGSFIVARTSFHESLSLRARAGHLPIAGPLYQGYGLQHGQHIHVGLITQLIDEGFWMEDRVGDDLLIIVTPETTFPQRIDFREGDQIFVIGEREEDVVRAQGIRRIDQDLKRFPLRPRP